MDPNIYKLIHLVALILVFLGLGAILSAGRSANAPGRKVGVMLHGLGLLAMLVAGFGLQQKGGLAGTWPNWLFAKIGVWVLLGALPFLVKRGTIPTVLGWLLAIALGGGAVWLVIMRPF